MISICRWEFLGRESHVIALRERDSGDGGSKQGSDVGRLHFEKCWMSRIDSVFGMNIRE